MPPKRILLLSASAGAGHLKAAEAMEKACRIRFPQAEVRNLDVLTLTPAPFRKAYSEGYLELVNRVPALLGLVYDRTNRGPVFDRLRLAVDRLNTRAFVDYVEGFAPDLICSTHFLPAQIVGHRKAKRGWTVPQALVVTDFEVHRFWVCPRVELYLTAREENRVHLQALGVAPARILATGIPIDPSFASRPETEGLRRRLGVADRLPLLLVLGGGFGVGPVEALVKDLWRHLGKGKAHLAVVCGRNEALRGRLSDAARRAPVPTKVLGFTTEMPAWMAAADLAVTKPGGLTTSEALARGLPLAVANPIPGQETRNAMMLYEEGAAISAENPLTAGWRVAALLGDPARLERMRKAARALGRPRAALDAAEALAALA